MVLIHEFGHYVAAKILKFKVVEFSVGFGPKLLQKKTKSGEKFSLRAIPLGGYCAFESEDEEGVETEKSFYKEKPWKRIIVLLSGALFNIISAVIFSFMFLLIVGSASTSAISVGYVHNNSDGVPYNQFIVGDVITHIGDREVDTTQRNWLVNLTGDFELGEEVVFRIIRNGEAQYIPMTKTWIAQPPTYHGFGFTYILTENGARVGGVAERAVAIGEERRPYNDLLVGDIIIAVNGNVVRRDTPLANLTQGVNLGDAVTFTVHRTLEGQTSPTELEFVIPKRIVDESFLGFGFRVSTHFERGFGRAITGAIPFTGQMSWAIIGTFGNLFTGGTAITDMTGPIGTVGQMAQISQADWRNILILLPLLAANLAIFNLLPFPALDGAKIVFTIIEWIRGKPINRNIENMIHLVGFAVLLLFVFSIDIVRLIMVRGPPAVWTRF